MPQKSFEDFLKDHSSQFAPAPKAGNWEAIANALPSEKKNRRVLWIWLSAACITITGPLSLLHYNPSKSSSTATSNSGPEQVAKQSAFLPGDSLVKTPAPNTIAKILPEITTPQRTLIKAPIPVIRKAERILASRVVVNTTPSDVKEPEMTAHIPEPEYEIITIDTTPVLKKDTSIKLFKSKKDIKNDRNRQLKHYLGLELASYFTDTRTEVNYSNTAAFNGPPSPSNPNEYKRNETDKALPGVQIGLAYSVQRKSGSIKTGLYYQQINYAIQVYNVNQNSLVGSGGRISNFDYNSSDSFAAGEGGMVKNSFRYLSIPLEYWRESFSMNRWHLIYGAGIRGNFLLSNKGINSQYSGYYVKTPIADRSVIQNFHMSVNAGIGISRDFFGQRYSWYLNAIYARSLSDIENSVVATGYQNFGLSAGIRYRLNNKF